MREYDPDEERLVETVELDDEPDLSLIFEQGWRAQSERGGEPAAAAADDLFVELSEDPQQREESPQESPQEFPQEFPPLAERVEEVEIPAQPEQQENWREHFAEARSESAGADAPEAAPATEEPQPEPSFAITDEEEPSGLIGKITRSIKIALSKDESEPAEEAGLDVSEPPSGLFGGLKARLAGEGALVAAVAQDKKTGFEDLIRPLSGPNLQVLQAQVAAEEPIFSQLQRAHRSSEARAHMAFYLGLIPLVAFFAVFGTSYLSEILSSASVPGWWIDLRDHFSSIDAQQWRQIGRIGLFSLGILLPFASLFVWVESIRRLLSGVGTRRAADLLVGLVGFGIALLTLIYLSQAMILSALVWLVAYGVISFVYSLWNRG